jgi:hypothetical protein
LVLDFVQNRPGATVDEIVAALTPIFDCADCVAQIVAGMVKDSLIIPAVETLNIKTQKSPKQIKR